MPNRNTLAAWIIALLAGILWAAPAPAQPKKDALTIVDFSGKEHQINGWRFTSGTRRLNWLASEQEKKAAKNPALVGPEVVEFSEGKGPPLVQRVVTWIALKNIRSIEYDHKKNTVSLTVAMKDGKDIILTGLTGYKNVNHLAIEAEEDLKEFGKAEFKFLGGVAQGVKKITFPSPVPVEPLAKGRPAYVASNDKNCKPFTAIDVTGLYQIAGQGLQPDPTMYFQKTVKVQLDKIAQLSHVGKVGLVFDVKLKSGTQKPLVLIETHTIEKKKKETLEGLLGRVEAGYKLVPMIALQQVNFDQTGAAAPATKE